MFALIFISALCTTTYVFLSDFVDTKTQDHKQTIRTVSNNMNTDDISIEELATQLGAILTANTHYQSLMIKNDGKVLFNFKRKNVDPIDSYLGKLKTVSSGDLNLQVQYKLSFVDAIELLTQLFIVGFIISVLFIIISAKLSYKLQSSIFKVISKEISNELSQINKDDFIDSKTDGDKLVEIPALQEGINEIRSMMTEQLKAASSLEVEAHIDSLTGMENRNRFVQYYENEIVQESPVNYGVLLITRCSELQTINQVHGYNSGDNYISKIAEIIESTIVTRPSSKVFRLNSSDFATIIPNEKLKVAEDYAQELSIKFDSYQQVSELDSIAFTGLVYFDKSKPLGELLALADTGVSVAQTQKPNSWYSQTDINILNDSTANFGNQNWRQEIDSVLENGRVKLLLQPIQPSGRNSRVYGEVLARFLNTNEDMLPTATFIAMAEKLDKIVEVDRLIIESVISEITSKNLLENSYGINISARSINDEHFMIWLERKLLREPAAAPRLIFEISEIGLQQNVKSAKRLVEVLHRVGSRVTVERFGVGLTSFKFFRDLTPDFIKMDSSYTRDIDDDKNNQYFLRLMVDLAHRLGINVLAESVESQEEKHTLEKLFIDGCQGYYVGKPGEL